MDNKTFFKSQTRESLIALMTSATNEMYETFNEGNFDERAKKVAETINTTGWGDRKKHIVALVSAILGQDITPLCMEDKYLPIELAAFRVVSNKTDYWEVGYLGVVTDADRNRAINLYRDGDNNNNLVMNGESIPIRFNDTVKASAEEIEVIVDKLIKYYNK